MFGRFTKELHSPKTFWADIWWQLHDPSNRTNLMFPELTILDLKVAWAAD